MRFDEFGLMAFWQDMENSILVSYGNTFRAYFSLKQEAIDTNSFISFADMISVFGIYLLAVIICTLVFFREAPAIFWRVLNYVVSKMQCMLNPFGLSFRNYCMAFKRSVIRCLECIFKPHRKLVVLTV